MRAGFSLRWANVRRCVFFVLRSLQKQRFNQHWKKKVIILCYDPQETYMYTHVKPFYCIKLGFKGVKTI